MPWRLLALGERRRVRLLAVCGGAMALGLPIAGALAFRPPTGGGSAEQAPAAEAPSPRAPQSPAAAPAKQRPSPAPAFPAPPRGAVVFSRQLGGTALALAAAPRPRGVLLQASVIGALGTYPRHLRVSFALQGRSRTARPCGPGCFRAVLPVRGRPATVGVVLRGGPDTRWRVALPRPWPAPDASGIVDSAASAWRSLTSLSYRETLASDARHVVASRWRVQAPDRVAYEVVGGWSAVIVGSRRWDRPPSGAWKESPQLAVTQPVPIWRGVEDAHVLGTTRVGGRLAWRVTFFDPQSSAWFELALDRTTLRTLDLRMVTTSHFMHDVFGSFDAARPITPPGSSE